MTSSEEEQINALLDSGDAPGVLTAYTARMEKLRPALLPGERLALLKHRFWAEYAPGFSDESNCLTTVALSSFRGFRGFCEISLRAAYLRSARLRNLEVHNALDLTQADLTGADLTGADLRRTATMRHACLANTVLEGACLTGAQLDRADMTGALLRGANLTEASLLQTDLRRADLTLADIIGADMSHAHLPLSILAAYADSYTRLTSAALYADDGARVLCELHVIDDRICLDPAGESALQTALFREADRANKPRPAVITVAALEQLLRRHLPRSSPKAKTAPPPPSPQ